MTIGERIQTYRKHLNLSQAELGQKLLVDPHTINLWETDQTVPSIDHLIRLKEVLGVSLDDILNAPGETKPPAETYWFSFLREEIEELYRLQKFEFYKRPFLLAAICVLLILSLLFSSTFSPDFSSGLAFGILTIDILVEFKWIFSFRKAWKNNKDVLCTSAYEYQIFDNFFLLTIYRNGEQIRQSKYRFTDIERVQSMGSFLTVQFGGQAFLIRKNDLPECSFFYSYLSQNLTKSSRQIVPNAWRISSILLLIASLFSIVGAIMSVGALSTVNHLFNENMWLFFLWTPLPLASIVFGFVLKSKHYKYKKNLIAGIIMTILLCIYGSFVFMAS